MKSGQQIPMLPETGLWSIEPLRLQRIQAEISRFNVTSLTPEIESEIRKDGELQVEGDTAVISLMGPMEKRSSWFGYYAGFASTEGLRRQVERATADSTVKKILLRVDSPGGSVDGLAELGDAVWQARKSGKKIVAQVDGMAASAAYYVAAQANEINAHRMDLIGSIGTRLVLWDMSKFFEEAGIKVIPVDTGEFKTAGEPGTPITDAHVDYFQGLVDSYFADFKKAVLRGREMTPAKLEAVANGKVWTAPEAKDLGLIDSIQTYDNTFSKLRGKRVSARFAQQRFLAMHR